MSGPYSLGVGDEAGDLGFQFSRGSSAHFVACLVLLDDADALRQFVEDYRHRFHLTDAPEFGFHSSSDRNRSAFLEGLMQFDVAMRAVVVDKRTLLPNLRGRKLELYVQYWGETLTWVLGSGDLREAKIVLDEFDNPAQSILALTRRLRYQQYGALPVNSLASIRPARSHSEPLLQVADMAAGAVLRLAEEGDARFHRIVRRKTLIWRWGENENPPR